MLIVAYIQNQEHLYFCVFCVNTVELDEGKTIQKELNDFHSILLSCKLTFVCFRMVRRSVLFAVCSLFLSVNSQNLLTDFSDQLFETRSWLAGKRNRTCCWFLFYIIIIILLNIINTSFITWHCMSQGCPFTRTYSCSEHFGEGCKTRTSCTMQTQRDATDSSVVVYFFCPPGAKSWFTLNDWQAARWPCVTGGSQAIWIYFFF